jgi:integrase/recombinase XerD
VSEATGADIEHLGLERGAPDADDHPQGRQGRHHPAGAAHRPGDRPGIAERTGGPVFLAADGRRLDRHGAGRIVRKVARRAGIAKAVTPHTLRHAFITAAPVWTPGSRCAMSKGPPRTLIRTTMRYDRARGSLDRHATYIVAAYIAGAARQPAPAGSSAWRRRRPGGAGATI